MQLAIMAYSFILALRAGTMSTAEVIRFTREVGVEAIELMDDFVIDPASQQVLRAALAETGMSIACYDIAADLAAAEPARRAAVVAGVEVACQRAAALGAPHVLLIPTAPSPEQPVAAVRQAVGDGLRACLPAIQRLGLTASLPNLGELAAYYGQLDVVASLLEAAGPELGLTYDVGNWLLAGADPLLALEQLGPRIRHVHLKDWLVEPDAGRPDQGGFLGLDGRRYLSTALGEGRVDLAGALAGLHRHGYNGYLSIEYEGLDEAGPPLRRSVAHARRLLAELPPRRI